MASNIRQRISANRGPLLVVLSQILSSFVNFGAKVLITGVSPPMSPFRILNARMIINLTLSSIYCWCRDVEGFPAGPRHVRCLLVLRAVGGCCAAIGFYCALKDLPLADATVLNLLAPLGSCILVGLLLRRAHAVSMVRIGATVMSVVGVIIITRPPLIFDHFAFWRSTSTEDTTTATRNLLQGNAFALLGAAGGAVSSTVFCVVLGFRDAGSVVTVLTRKCRPFSAH